MSKYIYLSSPDSSPSMHSLRNRGQNDRVFGKAITNQSINVAGDVAGAEKENVNLKGIKKRGSNENGTGVVGKKPKVDNQENAVPNIGQVGKNQTGCPGGAIKKVAEKQSPVQVESVISTAGQCLLSTVSQVECHVRSLDISEDDTSRRSTRSASQKPGLLGQIFNAAIETSMKVIESAAGPSKPKRLVASPFKELIKNRTAIDFSDPSTYYEAPVGIPDDLDDFDKTQVTDATSEPQYADSVFKYYKHIESKHLLTDYMVNQKHVTKAMRAVLVDWMVEVQESFELNHETLYLGVKLVDHYLSKEIIAKEKFQLLGATCLFIAAKFDVSPNVLIIQLLITKCIDFRNESHHQLKISYTFAMMLI